MHHALLPLVKMDSTSAGRLPGPSERGVDSRDSGWVGARAALPASVAGAQWRIFRAITRRGAKKLAQAVLPRSVVAWHGPPSRRTGGARRKPCVALTFDDGPGELTQAYLTVLDRYQARATFFVVGSLCAARPDLVAAITAAGHEVAGHGYTHRPFPALTADSLREELVDTAALLPRGRDRRLLVRPPRGAISASSILTCAKAGFTTALWSHDSGDWHTTSADDVCAAFAGKRTIAPGAVVLFHEGQPWTLRALPTVLTILKEAGHEFVPMGELLGG